jgi:hypothetical protein
MTDCVSPPVIYLKDAGYRELRALPEAVEGMGSIFMPGEGEILKRSARGGTTRQGPRLCACVLLKFLFNREAELLV